LRRRKGTDSRMVLLVEKEKKIEGLSPTKFLHGESTKEDETPLKERGQKTPDRTEEP